MEHKEVIVAICPHTNKEVLMQSDPGNTDALHDWLCLHGDTEEEDEQAVKKWKDGHQM